MQALVVFMVVLVTACVSEDVCPQLACQTKLCPTGRVHDTDGCPTCGCCGDVMCAMFCAAGNKIGPDGCKQCLCCPEVMCNMYCEKGFRIGEDGCQKCDCN